MGRSLANKEAIVAELKQTLGQTQMTLVIDYQGLTVAEMTDLRRRLRPTGTVCKVTKNTLMGIAIRDNPTWQPMESFLRGTTAFLLVQDDLPGAVKAYQEFQKATKKTELRGGVMEGQALDEKGIKAVLELPPKEVLMAKVAGMLKTLPTQLATALHAVPTQLATGINEVPASLGRAIQAVAQREDAAVS
jgi:large subunit ribosomal protein L10